MAQRIVPSLIAKNKQELNKRFNQVKDITNVFQLDVMDGIFVPNKSLMFDFELPTSNTYEAHLMIQDPLPWIQKRISFLDTIIVHYEVFSSLDKLKEIIAFVKKHNKKIGIAITPRTSLAKIMPLIPFFSLVLIMTVHPGSYGAQFLPGQLTKVKQVRAQFPRKLIEVDGGMSETTIPRALRAGVNHFVVGSVLQQAQDPRTTFTQLQALVRK